MLVIRATTHFDLDQVEREASKTYGAMAGDVVIICHKVRLWFSWTGARLMKTVQPAVPSIRVGA
ncbi:hypothetical protein [Pseudomonas mediterranea]|uniref:hypothetical protein n=1 Tax=Pseudomonas mediterranea TaxID=183795 RepID=UPI0006D8B53D|nr:hypothetical protein [Pseudomonas mediterranea]